MTDRKRHPLADHPLLAIKAVQFETPAYLNLVTTLTEWLWQGTTGGFIVGEPRVGKSWAMQSLTDQLRLRDGKIVPVTYMSMVDRDQKTIAEVPRRACIDSELAITANARADQLSKQLHTYICDLQVEADVRTSILIVDEFDHLKPRQFNAFAEFFNMLDGPPRPGRKQARSLVIVFVGNKEEACVLLREMTGKQHKRIRGRFCKRLIEYYGLLNREELAFIMGQYDTLRFPADGPTYTAAFLPDATDAGWRFKSLAKDLWRVYALIAREYSLDSWGMEYAVGTLNVLLTDLLPRYGWRDIEDDLLREAILMTHVADDFVDWFLRQSK